MQSRRLVALIVPVMVISQADATFASIYQQDFETYSNGDSIGMQSPWTAGDSTTEQVNTSAKHTGNYGWQVRLKNDLTGRRRAYDTTLLATPLTDATSFTLSLWVNNFEKANSGANVGFVGLFDTETTTSGADDYAPLHNFIGINLGGNGADRHPYYGLQVRTPGPSNTTGFAYQQDAALSPDGNASSADGVIVGGSNQWYRLVVAYDTVTRTFTYNAYDAGDNVVIMNSVVLPADKHFTVNSFGAVDGSATEGRNMGVYIDDVQVVPEPAATALLLVGTLVAGSARAR